MKIKHVIENRKNVLKNIILHKLIFSFFFLSTVSSAFAQNCQIIDSAIVQDVSCYGTADGYIDIVLLDSLGSYTFVWNNLETTEDISGLSPTTYTVQIIDLNNPLCVQDTSFIVSQPQDPLSSTVNLYQNVFCFGDSTGVAYADVIGGTPPYTYLWDNGDTTQIGNGLWAGNHTVTFTDANGCTLIDGITIVNLHPEITGTINIIQDVSCFGECDAIAELSSFGGVLQHTYDWDISQTYIGSGPDTAFNLCYGGHDVIIEDALGCRKTISFNINQPDELFAQAIQVQPVQCYGFDDGISQASATGGTTPYSFVWDSLNGPIGQDIDSLTPGLHTIFVTDANGCTANDTVVIDEPTQLEVIIVDSMTIYSYCAGTNSAQLCALASGGTPSYVYSWNDNLNQTTACATNIIAQYNDYTIIVMDERNCIATASFQLDSITNSMNPDSVLIDVDNVSCFGTYDGSLSISNVVGAVPPYSYTWTGPLGYTGNGNYISSLYAGSYAVVIEDSNDCAITVNAEVSEPDELQYTAYNVIGESCYGACNGQIWVNVEGGVGNYYYDVSETGIFPIASMNQLQLVNDSLIFDLCQGVHSIYLTDDNNCEGALVWGGNFQMNVDSGVVVSAPGIVTSDASCFNTNDGQASIAWPGADPLFSYTWETDPVGTVIDTGVSTSILFPGNYALIVHYADSASFGQFYTGCDMIYPFSINGPNALLANEIVTDVSCFGYDNGSIILNPSSDASPFTFVWDTTTSVPGLSTASFQSSLQPGTYTVTITDADGCEITNDIIVDEPEAITSSISFISPLCYGDANGSATVIASGGVGGWNFSWIPSGGNNATANNLSAGIYTVNITDNNGCPASFSVTVTEPSELISSLEPNIFYNEDNLGNPYHISCFGASDGSAVVTAGGGVPPITYSWSSGGSLQEETGISAGPVTVTVSDVNNCTESQTITLNEPSVLNPNILENIYSTSSNGTTNEISCYGFSDGQIISNTIGGIDNMDYQYLWINDNTGLVVSTEYIAENLPANTSYTVTVTDANGCVSQSISTILDEPDEFIANVSTIDYAGATHAPFEVNFVDSTVSIDPFDFNWIWEDDNTYYSAGTLLMNHLFSTDNIGENNVYVIVTNLLTGCYDSVLFTIDVQGIVNVDNKNNVFTPNGDEYNNEFYFGEHAMKNIDVQIYNRWGQLVYSWSGENKSWDGRGTDGQDLPEAVYFYTLISDGIDGYHYEEKGSITLIR